MKIQALKLSPIPEKVLGRLRKDGKPDHRYTNSFYMLQEYMKQVSGVSENKELEV